MADMTRIPDLSVIPHYPSLLSRLGVAAWTYTTVATGALVTHTDNLGQPDGHDGFLYRLEVRTVGAQGNTTAELHLQYPSGHVLEDVQFLLHSWTFQGDYHAVAPLDHAIPFVSAMQLVISIADVDSGVQIILSAMGKRL